MENALSQFVNDPHIRHAALVHFPIVFALLGILPLIALLLTGLKSRPMKFLCIAWFLLASAGAYFAAEAGEDAEHHLRDRSPGMTRAEHQAVHQHEELAENGWIWPLIPAALVLLTFPAKGAVRKPAFVLATLGALGVAYWAGLTAQAGGKLVYDLGLGVEARGAVDPGVPAGAGDAGEKPSATPPGDDHEDDDAAGDADDPA